jgi:hypothetical protein
MWKTIAQALRLGVPEQQLDAIGPILDSLWTDTRRVLDRDLSLTDPAITFQAGLGGEL